MGGDLCHFPLGNSSDLAVKRSISQWDEETEAGLTCAAAGKVQRLGFLGPFISPRNGMPVASVAYQT